MEQSTLSFHPGLYIKTHVIPKGMTNTETAKKLGVGRPALSNMLNGKAALSADMATRFEKVFGVESDFLLDKQLSYEILLGKLNKDRIENATPWVPPFLQIKAKAITEWAGHLAARSRMAVFLRTLVNSSGVLIKKVDFPGNDDSERHGWDGYVEVESGSAWIPFGLSGWEFGVSGKPEKKANHDYIERVRDIPLIERRNMTFVFVTPQSWPGKKEWENAHRKDNNWKDVWAFDASDLEQWLEQSISGQAWFANETSIPSDGVRSLEACWKEWVADTEPQLSPALFSSAIQSLRQSSKKKLISEEIGESLKIAADSPQEAYAFLYSLISDEKTELSQLKDRVIIFEKPGQLTKLFSKSPHFIAVTANREVEKEIALRSKDLRAVLVYPRSTTNISADIVLEPLSYEPFREALLKMDYSNHDVDRLAHESGKSLTILRRRLSKSQAIRTPDWALNQRIANILVPILLAGAWDERNSADRIILEGLANKQQYEELDREILEILQLENSPIWSSGSFVGLVSKIDVLFAIGGHITKADIDRLMTVSSIVLADDDPSLDLPEEQRWVAPLYGKKREISSALRQGISESLVLLSIYGKDVLRNVLGNNIEHRIGLLIEEILSPLTVRKLESNSSDLPMYAEAAPDKFLNILENDLKTSDPQCLQLLSPINSDLLFGRCYRSGLLWALESLGWSRQHLHRAILILARLAEKEINDNWTNKPQASLDAIFRSWMPQTSASLEERIKILELLIKKFPSVVWKICVKQFKGRDDLGHYSHKPRWRTEGNVYGEPVSNSDAKSFALHALNLTLSWNTYNREMLGDLVESLRGLEKSHQNKIWSIIESWSKSALDSDIIWLREKIRVNCFTRRALTRKKKQENNDSSRARAVYELLSPSDVILKHLWLFQDHWVEESADELEANDINFEKRDERIQRQRKEAVLAVWQSKGLEGVVELAEKSKIPHLIGWHIAQILEKSDGLIDVVLSIGANRLSSISASQKQFIEGILSSLAPDQAAVILPKLLWQVHPSALIQILTSCPFNQTTWRQLESMNKEVEVGYWSQIQLSWSRLSENELHIAIDNLIKVKRPRAAFHLIHFEFMKVLPKQLAKLLAAIGSEDVEPSDINRLDSYYVMKAFERLNQSREITIEELAGLEFKYIEFFDDSEDNRITNLESQIELRPELYVQAVGFAYKRGDEKKDSEEFQKIMSERRAVAAHRLLDKISKIPGHDMDGQQTVEAIVDWVHKIQSGCKDLGRSAVGDLSLGKLFSNAPVGDDGLWPCLPVRDALEELLNEKMSDGLYVALYNNRGTHWRGKGGDQERDLADQYQQGHDALKFTHPEIAKVLGRLTETYRSEAVYRDDDATAEKHLRLT